MERERKDILISDLIYKSLRGSLKGDEAEILEVWLQKVENRQFYMELKNSGRLYEGLEKLEYIDNAQAWLRLKKGIAVVRRRRWIRRFYTVAALLVIACGLGILWYFEHQGQTRRLMDMPQVMAESSSATVWKMADNTFYLADTLKRLVLPQEMDSTKELDSTKQEKEIIEYQEVITAKRGRLEVVLADGTQVWLNGGSGLRFPSRFAVDSREVELCGEAYFEVVKDSLRPFKVKTTIAEIEVLGTSFNVEIPETGGCVTTLVEGCVQMEDKEHCRVILLPGQQAVLADEGGWKVEKVDTRYYTAWKEGLFAFRERTLEDILGALATYYGVQFVFKDKEIADLTYTTMVKQYDRVEDVLRILEEVGDFRCEVSDGIFMVKRK